MIETTAVKIHVCPFCAQKIHGAIPTHCPHCSNSFRDLTLDEFVENETFTDGLAKVTSHVKTQMKEINGRKNWYREDLVKKKPETNVKWDNMFATEYQRQNGMSVDDSVAEIEEFNRLMSAEEFDEAAWKAFMDKYNSSKKKRKMNLPVSEMFLEKLSHDRAKKDKDKEKHLNENEGGQSNGGSFYDWKKDGTKVMTKSNADGTVTEVSTFKMKPAIQKPEKPKAKFQANKSGKGRAEFSKYMNKKNAPKKLW